MRPANLFQVEMAVLAAGTRGLLTKLGLSLLLGLPFVLFAMPLPVRLAGLTAILTFSSFFGAAVGIVRRRTEGQLQRLALLPLRRSTVLLDLLLSFAVLDAAQLGILLALFLAIHAQDPTAWTLVLAAGRLLQAVVLLNALGLGLGLSLRSNPEVHLFGALAAGVLLALSGQIPVPARVRPLLVPIARWNPVSRFAASLGEAAGGLTAGGPPIGALVFLLLFASAIAWRAIDPGPGEE
jgi:ABC-type multidrug transport system permease subunit